MALRFSYVSKAGAVGGKVMPLNTLFNQLLHTYLQATASRHESPLSFTLRWRLVATTVERQAVFQVLDTTPHAGYRVCRHSSKQLYYDILSPEDMALFEEKCNPAILYPVYDAIERTRADKRPARAALLY
jgi:hypothetical protein